MSTYSEKETYLASWEEQYDKMREKLLVRDPKDSDEVYARKLRIANVMESANRVFLHFMETGKVSWDVL